MRLIPTFLTAVAMLTLTGCGVAYNSKRNEILRSASPESFGPPPPANRQSIEMALIRERLKDPESAKFIFGGVQRDAIQPSFASPQAVPVWFSACRVNAKNSYGGYAGFQPWIIAWRNAHPFAIMKMDVNEFGMQPTNWEYLH